MAERKFSRGLSKPGTALQKRENVTQAVRESTALNKRIHVEPIDYENYVLKNMTLIMNDPLRDMILYPSDDVSKTTTSRKFRTTVCTVPDSDDKQHGPDHMTVSSLLARECMRSYVRDWHVVNYKYNSYAGTYQNLTRLPGLCAQDDLVYEVDAELDQPNLNLSCSEEVSKEGFLLKGPEISNDSFISSFSHKSFKRRYACLRQIKGGSYILEFFKDDRGLDGKGTISLDSCQDITKNTKRAKWCFELRLVQTGTGSNKPLTCVLAAENEAEFLEWCEALTQAVQASKEDLSLGGTPVRKAKQGSGDNGDSPSSSRSFGLNNTGTLKSLEQSKNPELVKYARESDFSIAEQRKENRHNLFVLYQEIAMASGDRSYSTCFANLDDSPNVEPYKDQFGTRVLVRCDSIRFKLEGPPMERQVEPYFTTIALYDAKRGVKISEDFHFDVNELQSRAMLGNSTRNGSTTSNGSTSNGSVGSNLSPIGTEQELKKCPDELLFYPKQAVFNVSHPDLEIYLVLRIDKVLQGSISQAADPYIKSGGDQKVASKVQKIAATCCKRLGNYRMPFVWAARPVFKPFGHEVDPNSDFNSIFKQEEGKMSDEELLKILVDFKKPDKMSRFQTVPGTIRISLQRFDKQMPNCVTPNLFPVEPFSEAPKEVIREVEEFPTGLMGEAHPYVSYVNHLYVQPISLKYDTQKAFAKARNIACVVEFRDSDVENAQPLKCIYGRPGESVFTSQSRCSVLHHCTSPVFYEEVKINLPKELHDRHHLLFSFYHVSCEQPKGSNKKGKDAQAETPIGFAWIPILHKQRMSLDEQSLPVAIQLLPGYLSHESLGLSKGFSGPDIKWVESQKPLFKVGFKLVSTIYTKDQHINNFFAHAQKMLENRTVVDDLESSKLLRLLPKIDVNTAISFLPTLFNQLLRLLVTSTAASEDVALNALHVIVHILHQVHEAGKNDILHSYVKHVFVTSTNGASSADVEGKSLTNGGVGTTMHEELAMCLAAILRPANTEFLVLHKLLRHSWFFFQIMVKSMAQHLLPTRIKMHRNERFPADYQYKLKNLQHVLLSHIIAKYKEIPIETRQANRSLAFFVRKCLTFMDRGKVFELVNLYMEKFSATDPKVLQEYKFEYLRIVTSHEHYVSLNLPIARSITQRGLPKTVKELESEYRLSEEFCRDHFLVGILLQETRLALNEVSDVRRMAVSVLKDLLIKHSYDDRYQSKAQQARVVSLYLPFLGIVLNNINRLTVRSADEAQDKADATPTGATISPVHHQHNPSSVSMTRSVSSQISASTSTTNGSKQVGGSSRPHTGIFSGAPLRGNTLTSSGRNQRDSTYLSLIAGQVNALAATNGSALSLVSNESSDETLSQSGSQHQAQDSHNGSERDLDGTDGTSSRMEKGHTRSQSVPFVAVRYDKLEPEEVRNILVCFVYILKHVSEELLIGWWQQCVDHDLLDFFQVIGLCLQQFRYIGKKQIAIQRDQGFPASRAGLGGQKKAFTLPARVQAPSFASRTISVVTEPQNSNRDNDPIIDLECVEQAKVASNLTNEVSLIILDVLGLFCVHFRDKLDAYKGDNPIMRKVFDTYLLFMQLGQSDKLMLHAFAAHRIFVNMFPACLFEADVTFSGRLCYEVLKCCNSRVGTTRHEACALLYLLMRANYEFTGKKGMTRVHLQVMIAVSQLLGEILTLNSSMFQESLSVINSFAASDKAMQSTNFPNEVKDLIKKVQTVLMATSQMREHENDPEMLVDLQHRLANSYAATPELRRTWLEAMARNHEKNKDYSELAHCKIHTAALVAECLREKYVFPAGCDAFIRLSANVVQDEKRTSINDSMQDVDYTEDTLLQLVQDCADALEKAERYELVSEIYRIAIPLYEQRRDYESLADCYGRLQTNYLRIVQNNKLNRGRLLGKYFRITYYGQSYFDDESGKEYVYKEGKVTSLAEMSERLYALHCDKFGREAVKMIMDSNKVDVSELDHHYAYIQVTHVTPYFDESEISERLNEFERQDNLRRFSFDTPFTMDGKKARGSLEEQCKRRTIITTCYAFPYVKKRVGVCDRREVVLSPIEVAVDEMQTRVAQLGEVTFQTPPDMKKLQLTLQGSISVQVNAGPLAYAAVFLDSKHVDKYPRDKVTELKEIYRQFVKISSKALDLNATLITADQYDYQEAMRNNFNELVQALSSLLHEKFYHDNNGNGSNRNSIMSNAFGPQ